MTSSDPLEDHSLSGKQWRVENARLRLFEVLRRHVRADDNDMTDKQLVLAVIKRWRSHLKDPLLDPYE